MDAANETFGKLLRKLRLEAGFGLRVFAEAIGMKPSNLSRLETERLPPPNSAERIAQIAEALGLNEASAEFRELNDLAAEAKPGRVAPDVQDYAAQQPGVPLLLRTAKGKQLDEEQFRRLAEYIERNF
jgi:transcriptional regulator with XRE-family HTH domain